MFRTFDGAGVSTKIHLIINQSIQTDRTVSRYITPENVDSERTVNEDVGLLDRDYQLTTHDIDAKVPLKCQKLFHIGAPL